METLRYQQHDIRYRSFGHGPKFMIAMHGFADKSEVFNLFQAKWGEQYTVVAPDMPFHGETQWQGEHFTPTDMANIIREFMRLFHADTCTLSGHSMGGRIAFHMLAFSDIKIDALILFAPAGLKGHWYYSNWVQPRWLVKVFYTIYANTTKAPIWFTWLAQVGLMPKSTVNFFAQQFSAPHRRDRLFRSWMAMTSFPITPKVFQARLNERNIPLTLLLGERDSIVPPQDGIAFAAKVPSAQTIMVPSNHFIFQYKDLVAFVP
jgi:pimeloyl-ACP methyl ester carboxylesterase